MSTAMTKTISHPSTRIRPLKSFATKEAVAQLKKTNVIGSETLVMSLQNGLGNEETIAEVVGEDNVISGKFSGTLLSHSYTGTWSANGESNAFSASVKGSENDPLGFSNKFVEGLNRATSYKGNYDNLFIYYKDEGGRELCLVFHVDKDNNK